MSVRHQDLPALLAALSEAGGHSVWLHGQEPGQYMQIVSNVKTEQPVVKLTYEPGPVKSTCHSTLARPTNARSADGGGVALQAFLRAPRGPDGLFSALTCRGNVPLGDAQASG